MDEQPFDGEFRALYERLGFVGSGGQCVALHLGCVRAPACWHDVKDVHKPDREKPESQIYRPWIGSRYTDTGLLAVGLNMNGWGGYDAFYRDNGIPRAKVELETKNVVFANSVYRGTLFQVRLLACVWAVLRAAGIANSFADLEEIERAARNPDSPKRRDLIAGYDCIALTNAVKCGPAPCDSKNVRCGSGKCVEHRNGAPTGEMASSCPHHVLNSEIGILKPKMILSFGGMAGAAVESLRGGSTWRHFKATHPAAFGYRLLEVMKTLKS